MDGLPGYVWALMLVGVLGIPAATCGVLYRAARRGGMDGRRAAVVAGGVAVALAGWLAVAAVLGATGLLRQRADGALPGIGLGAVFLVVLVALLAATRIPAISAILDTPGTAARLILPQAFRVAGVVFVVAWSLGRLPAVFALPAGVGDILVGLSAPLAYRRHVRGVSNAARWFHLLGLADLVIAVTLGFAAGLGPGRLLDVTPSTLAVSELPLMLVPVVAVPLAITLHIVSLRRLARQARRAPEPRRHPLEV